MKRLGKHRSAGFSIIEVLVSVVILSFALLGTAALTGTSLKNTNNSYYRSQATVLADDILDRMRANIKQARGGKYDIDSAGNVSGSANTMEKFDCDEWLQTLTDTLPGGKGTVGYDSGTGVVTITIEWDDGADSFTTNSQL